MAGRTAGQTTGKILEIIRTRTYHLLLSASQEEKRERLMMELEHAKLIAKIAKKKEERAIQASRILFSSLSNLVMMILITLG